MPHHPGTPLNIGFVLPAITVGSGGLRKVLRICYDLERFGHRVCLYVMGNANAADSRAAIRRHYYPFAGQVFRYNGTVGPRSRISSAGCSISPAAIMNDAAALRAA